MRSIYIILLQSLMILVISGCATSHLEIVSNPPGSDIYIQTDKQLKLIGKTPLKIEDEFIQEENNYLISKKGYTQQLVFLEKRSLPSTGKISVKLKKQQFSNIHLQDPAVKETIRTIVRKVSTIQSSLIRKNYTQAEVLSQELISEHPDLSIGWNMLGNTFYLIGRASDAINAYNKALEIDPNNPDTLDVIRKIQRAPAERNR